MEPKSVRQVSSAGYRFPERPKETRPARSRSGTHHDPGEAVRDTDRKNPLIQDKLWKDVVSKERKLAQQWEKTWGPLSTHDSLGQPREKTPLPSKISVFSDSFPNTSNQMYGFRQFTPLGKEMIRTERLILWSGSHRRRRKPDLEMKPC